VLAERLDLGPIARLRRIRRSGSGQEADAFTAAIDAIVNDLDLLAHGLSPAALDNGRPLREALVELASGAGVPVDHDLDESVDRLPDDTAALIYYATAECLTNVARHAHATVAHLRVRLDPGRRPRRPQRRVRRGCGRSG
jgi:signal transduction histidine kinase